MRRLFKIYLVGVVIEVTLDMDDGGTLVAGAGGQVAQGADQVGQAAGGRQERFLAGSPRLKILLILSAAHGNGIKPIVMGIANKKVEVRKN